MSCHSTLAYPVLGVVQCSMPLHASSLASYHKCGNFSLVEHFLQLDFYLVLFSSVYDHLTKQTYLLNLFVHKNFHLFNFVIEGDRQKVFHVNVYACMYMYEGCISDKYSVVLGEMTLQVKNTHSTQRAPQILPMHA